MIKTLSNISRNVVFSIVFASVGLCSSASAWSGEWVLSGAESKVAFGSIKKDTVGEVHHFTGLSGSVAADGTVSVAIDVNTVQTFVDIRNERFLQFVFAAGAPNAVLSTRIDLPKLEALKPGDTADMDIVGKLTFNAIEVPIETTMFIARLSPDRVLVTTDEMIMLSTADLGIDAGIDQMQEIAKLSGITRVAPVTVRLLFTR